MRPARALLSAPNTALLLALSAGMLPACASSGVPQPVPGGRIGTLEPGRYVCEMPGDAAGAAGKPVTEFEFQVVNSSSYKAQGIRGSYLHTGDRVVMTSGKLRGLKLHRITQGFLRHVLADGSEGPMRCVLSARR